MPALGTGCRHRGSSARSPPAVRPARLLTGHAPGPAAQGLGTPDLEDFSVSNCPKRALRPTSASREAEEAEMEKRQKEGERQSLPFARARHTALVPVVRGHLAFLESHVGAKSPGVGRAA